MRNLFWIVFFVFQGSCFFMPNLEESGYSSCETSEACSVGRTCLAGYCVPPPWNDDAYGQRRLLIAANESDKTLPQGAAITFWVGESGMTLDLEDVAGDTRYTYYDASKESWHTLPVFLDTFSDRYAVWVPLQQDLASGERAPLVWLESLAEEGEGGATNDPFSIFELFTNFGDVEACETPWLCYGTGAPVKDDAVVRVEDNQMMVFGNPAVLPFDISFKLRVNGSNCQNVFWGLKASKNQSFDPPMLGFNVGENRSMKFEVYPSAESLAPVTINLEDMDTALHSYRIHAGDSTVRIYKDQTLLEILELETAFDENATLYPYMDVDGSCSLEIRNLWGSPVPVGSVKVTPQTEVSFQLF